MTVEAPGAAMFEDEEAPAEGAGNADAGLVGFAAWAMAASPSASSLTACSAGVGGIIEDAAAERNGDAGDWKAAPNATPGDGRWPADACEEVAGNILNADEGG